MVLCMNKATTGLLMVGLLVSLQQASAKEKPSQEEPDYTKGYHVPEKPMIHNLGPIGVMGEIWSGKHGTDNTRMIRVHEVMKDTPATGVLIEHDVILGIGTTKFTSDARKALSAAITEAEKKENGGKLVLNVWRPETTVVEVAKKVGKKTEMDKKVVLKEPVSGKTMPVTLVLPLKGSYSATAPWDCEKTKKIIDEAAQRIVKCGFSKTTRSGDDRAVGGVMNYVDALGLLATGEDKYLPVLQDYARTVAHGCEDLNIMTAKFRGEEGGTDGISSWHGSYRNLFLTEYYLVTKDQEVLPGITSLSTYIALGVSGVGTWSHGMANVRRNGLYGPPCAYGAMNSCSVICAMSLILAQKCGIDKPEINDAVQRSLKFYRWYVDKGSIPYGDHAPWMHLGNNGKNAMTAVLFDIAGEKKYADYFTRMALASYNEMEPGHTGNYFSWLWGALGASRGGPEAAQSFFKNTQWFTELERRADGSFSYQPQLFSGEYNKYWGWSTTGSRLLHYGLSRKAIYITGKGGSCVDPIAGDDLKTVVAAGVFDPSKLSVKELLVALGSWCVIVRQRAAEELGNRNEDVSKDLVAMLASPNRYARYGACVGLEFAGRKSEAGVDALLKKVESDKDMNMRFFAVNSLTLPRPGQKANGLGDAVKRAATPLMRLAATFEPEQDPGRKLQAIISEVIFYDGNVQDFQGYFPGGKGTEKLDRALLIPALKSFLINANGRARSSASVAYDDLSEEDLKQLWGDIYYASLKPAPSGVMFAGAVRTKGFELMASHHVKEGLTIGPDIMFRIDAWGEYARGIGGISALKPYGQALKEYYADIEKFLDKARGKEPDKKVKSLELDYEYIKKTPAPELWSIAPYIEAYEQANGIKHEPKQEK
jgi:hypothetical protein